MMPIYLRERGLSFGRDEEEIVARLFKRSAEKTGAE